MHGGVENVYMRGAGMSLAGHGSDSVLCLCAVNVVQQHGWKGR